MEKSRREPVTPLTRKERIAQEREALARGESVRFPQGFTLTPKTAKPKKDDKPSEPVQAGSEQEQTASTAPQEKDNTTKPMTRREAQKTMLTKAHVERTFNKIIPDKTTIPLDEKPENLGVMDLLRVVSYYDECLATIWRYYNRVAISALAVAFVLILGHLFASVPMWVSASALGVFGALTIGHTVFLFIVGRKRARFENKRDELLVAESKAHLKEMRAWRESRAEARKVSALIV